VGRGDGRQVAPGAQHQRLDAPHPRQQFRPGRAGQQLVDAIEPLEVRIQPLGEQGVQHEAEHLPEGRRSLHGRAQRGPPRLAHPDDHDPVGTEPQRRRQRRGLPHRAVAEMGADHPHGREQERDGGTRHQVVEPQFGGDAALPRALPALRRPGGVDERHPLARREAGRRHRQRVEEALVEVLPDAREVAPPLEQLPQGRVVQQRLRRRQQPATRQQGEQHLCPGPQDDRRIGAEHLLHAEVPPHPVERRGALAEARGIGGQHGREDGPGGRAAQDAEGQRRARGTPAGDRVQDADLVGRTRPAPRQHEGHPRRGRDAAAGRRHLAGTPARVRGLEGHCCYSRRAPGSSR